MSAHPPTLTKVWNLAGSIAAFVADGCAFVSKEQYAERLAICDQCPDRDPCNPNMCKLCGCVLSLKAQARACDCPATPSKWPQAAEQSAYPKAEKPHPTR